MRVYYWFKKFLFQISVLMNIGLKSIFSRAVLQLFPCSLWYGKNIIFKYTISFRVAALATPRNYTKNDYFFIIIILILLKYLVDKYISNSTCTGIHSHQPLL